MIPAQPERIEALPQYVYCLLSMFIATATAICCPTATATTIPTGTCANK